MVEKVIFLDIDGVLNSVRTFNQLGGLPRPSRSAAIINPHLTDPDALNMLRDICARHNAVCILSSSWRRISDHVELGRVLNLPIVGKTPSLVCGEMDIRGKEIDQWIQETGFTGKFVIIDDDADMMEHQLPNFVQTTWEDGFTSEHAAKVERILNV